MNNRDSILIPYIYEGDHEGGTLNVGKMSDQEKNEALIKTVAETIKDDKNVAILRDLCSQTTAGLIRIFWSSYWASERASAKGFADALYAWVDLNVEEGGEHINSSNP